MAPRRSRIASLSDPLDDTEDSSSAPTGEREELKVPNDDTAPSFPGLARDPLVDTTVSGFQVEGILGRGAAGIVYRVNQLTTGRKAAFKVLKPEFAEEPEYIRRLIEEARALSALRHPGIIDILDFGALPNGQPYLVMELCDGLSLEEQLRLGGKPTLRETLGLLDELLSALIVAHDHGVIHRDVKPSNLFLATNDDGTRSLKVLDFGLARMGDHRRSRRPTMPGAILGTPDYMAPEQILGTELGGWTDLYATGSLAFRLLTNRLPFIGKTGIEVISLKMDGNPPRARDVDPSVPLELDTLVYELMSRDPRRRPSTRQAQARFAAFLTTREGGPRPSLTDAEAARPTTFHQFDDHSAARKALAKTLLDLGPLPRPSFPPPVPKTELEQAHVPGAAARGWLMGAGLLLFVVGAAVTAWWIARGP